MSPTETTLLQRFPLRKIKILKKALGNTISWSVFIFISSLMVLTPLIGLLSVGIGLLASISLLIPFSVLLPLLVALVYQTQYYKNYFYDLTPDGLVIGKGVINTWRITVPRNKVQEVYLDQDLWDRIFGLYDLHLATATDVSGREAHIDGLGAQDAETLRSLLLQWVGGSDAKSPVQASTAVYDTFRPSMIGFVLRAPSILLWLILLLPFLSVSLIIPGVIVLIIVPILLAIAYLDFKAMRYELREDGVFIHLGFFIPRESTYLYRNIQDVGDDQALLDRLLGIHTLSVKTMTGESAIGARLLYLSDVDARRLRDDILRRSKKAMSAATVPKAQTRMAQAPVLEVPGMAGTVSMPFRNDFMRAAIYSGTPTFAAWVVLGVFALALSSLLSAPGPGGFVALACGAIAVLFLVSSCIGAIVSQMSYYYELARDSVLIRIQFLSSTKRQIPYAKIQDIEKQVSFLNSFAGLADIKLETGSKEYSGRKEGTLSTSVANESICALKDADAESLKRMLAKAIGVSIEMAGAPLVKRLPLDKRKPLKKTIWWVIYFAVLLVILAPFSLVFLALAPIVSLAVTVAAVLVCGMAVAAKYLYEVEYYKKYYYDLNEDVLVIKKGVFGSREIVVPLERIQDVFIDRDLLDRYFGLYDVYVSTATARSILNAHLDGLDAKNAEKAALLLADLIAKKK